MSRNWKDLSKKAAGLEEGSYFLLSNPEYSLDTLPDEVVHHRYEEPVVGGDTPLTPKELRSFFWQNRRNRVLTRPTATVWREGNTYGFGAVVLRSVLERLSNGY